MVVNSLGDWVVYGLGLVVMLYGAARLLPEMVVGSILALYRAYRKLRIGLNQVRMDLPLEPNRPRQTPLGQEPVVELMTLERESWA
jgi:hypothetical protein